MKLFKKISIFTSFILALTLIFSLSVFAAEATKDTKSSDFAERLEFALQGTVTGILMVFSVLGLLTLILYLSKVVFYDVPKKKREKEKEESAAAFKPFVTKAEPTPVVEEPLADETDDTELAAVITAAIAAMLESEEYADQFKSGFRVVSFKRAEGNGAWNKK